MPQTFSGFAILGVGDSSLFFFGPSPVVMARDIFLRPQFT